MTDEILERVPAAWRRRSVGKAKRAHPASNSRRLKPAPARLTRREVLVGVAGTAAAGTVLVRPAEATPEMMKAAIHRVIGEQPVRKGKVTLDIPPLVENGNTIAMSVAVDSPMTETNYVKAIHVFNEKNPQPNIISVHLGPRAGKAAFSTRIRLADSQNVVAIAELSDGSLWSDTVEVIVTIAACLEYN